MDVSIRLPSFILWSPMSGGLGLLKAEEIQVMRQLCYLSSLPVALPPPLHTNGALTSPRPASIDSHPSVFNRTPPPEAGMGFCFAFIVFFSILSSFPAFSFPSFPQGCSPPCPVVGCRWAPGRAPSPRTLKELYLGPNGSLTAQQHLPG